MAADLAVLSQLSGPSRPSSTMFNIIKKKTISAVWVHFGLQADEANRVMEDDMERPICCECHKVVPAKGRNTSILFSVLREHYPTLFAGLTSNSWKKCESSVINGKQVANLPEVLLKDQDSNT
uniref:BED-type domain-containing protein n=1 Tax=Amphimedon queenslandica TaxID=400682 RepID=A0A1X7V691_AMPQE